MKKSVITILVCVGSLLGLGLVMLHSIDGTLARTAGQNVGRASFFGLQLCWGVPGVLIMFALSSVDYRVWRRFAWPFMWLVVMLLVLVFLPPLGHRIKGAYRMLSFGPLLFQPVELAKLAVILFLAHVFALLQKFRQVPCTELQPAIPYPRLASFFTWFMPVWFFGLAVLLIFLEPAFCDALLTLLAGLVVMFLGGMKPRYLAVVGGAAFFICQFIAWQADPQRWMSSVAILFERNASSHPACLFYPCLAFVKGGWTGVGLGQSQTMQYYYPEAADDFVTSVIGEELGMIGVLLVVLAFVALVAAGIHISLRARAVFGTLLGMGLSCLIGLQALLNLTVATGTLHLGSVSLPFISYTGFGLVVELAAVGLLLSIARHTDQSEAQPKVV
ncbi:MAG: FtsW/RodA/SpoVE family cell cycle protein [bacterium]